MFNSGDFGVLQGLEFVDLNMIKVYFDFPFWLVIELMSES